MRPKRASTRGKPAAAAMNDAEESEEDVVVIKAPPKKKTRCAKCFLDLFTETVCRLVHPRTTKATKNSTKPTNSPNDVKA